MLGIVSKQLFLSHQLNENRIMDLLHDNSDDEDDLQLHQRVAENLVSFIDSRHIFFALE